MREPNKWVTIHGHRVYIVDHIKNKPEPEEELDEFDEQVLHDAELQRQEESENNSPKKKLNNLNNLEKAYKFGMRATHSSDAMDARETLLNSLYDYDLTEAQKRKIQKWLDDLEEEI